ncbi:DUF6023 family protein [Actinoplanes sp. KI2]|uniref:DUF6023 family protein n=1 Tax=Actinoplanes sp. KI2 TaxID=2983315 RepID=UPI0021D57112|nr:DUF6023 family protein [Actinoplanes sp. KI2]MCU7727256.1 DUF6023 family protein [Actinoplanes sp. KI2]
MRVDRARGAALYAAAAVLLAAGTTWWFRAAPSDQADPTIERWTQSAERLLPHSAGEDDADTVALAAGSERQLVSAVESGTYWVAVVCVGGGDSRVRVSMGEPAIDSGRGLDCTLDAQTDEFKVATAGRLRMYVTVDEAGPVVFRYTLHRTAD